MSNTGHKGIYSIWMNGRGWYKVAVMWQGRSKNAFVRRNHFTDPLGEAIRVRNDIEAELGKPRTEVIIRSAGVFNQRVGRSNQVRQIEWRK